MAIVTKPNTFTAGTTAKAAEVNQNFDTIYNDHNGNITNANLSGSAGIIGSKLDLSSPGSIGATAPAPGKFTTLEATTSLKLSAGATVTELSIDGTLAGDSDVAVPTEKAVKTYVDALPTVNPLALAKAWVAFKGATGTISSQFNVASVTKNSTGYYSIVFTTAMTDANYAVVAMTNNMGASDTQMVTCGLRQTTSPLTTGFDVTTIITVNGSNAKGVTDATNIFLVIFGN